jgi:hypothetical protein
MRADKCVSGAIKGGRVSGCPTCFRGAFPPVDFLAVCLVRAIAVVVVDSVGDVVDGCCG